MRSCFSGRREVFFHRQHSLHSESSALYMFPLLMRTVWCGSIWFDFVLVWIGT